MRNTTYTLLAQADTDNNAGNLGSFRAPSTAYTVEVGENAGTAAISNFDRVISVAIGGFTLVATIYFIFVLLIAAFDWLSSAGESSKIQKAKDSITNGLIGLVILVASYAIVGVVGTLVGINILNPGELLQKLEPGAVTNDSTSQTETGSTNTNSLDDGTTGTTTAP